MVLLAAAAGPLELELWTSRLQQAGIRPHVINVGDYSPRGTSVYAYEVWVREKDEIALETSARVIGKPRPT
jgi:hypothetical protein